MTALFTGFAVADRLPSQVPDNQIFTIDTIIDVTGQVTDESIMSWTIDDQNITRDLLTVDDEYVVLSSEDIAALEAAGVKVVNSEAGVQSVDVVDSNLDKLLPVNVQQDLGISTYQELINLLTTAGYSSKQYADRGSIHDSKLNPTEEIAILAFSDSIRTNGGKTALSKSIDFDSRNKGSGLNNLQVQKVLTYASTEGSHLTGSESWSLDVAGNYENTADDIRCVFAAAASTYFPAFCNVVKAKSELINVNSAQISTKGAVRAVASSGDVPAALAYQIAVTPDANAGSGFADGTIKTMYGGSIMEARQDHNKPSATNVWKDSASVSGGIKNFQKALNYESGFSY